jgi:dephospho-CoA kinase
MGLRRQLKIGVTGGIGSGKSVVCRIFSCLGIPIYNADDRAKWLTVNNLCLKNNIISLLGDQAYTADGEYNRAYVASRVFGNPQLLQQLNGLIHPLVKKDTAEWNEVQSQFSTIPYSIKEAALMNRAGDSNDLDFVIVVIADEDLRVHRVRERDPERTEEQIRAIMRQQMLDTERVALADFVVQNNKNSSLIDQVIALHQRFSS